MVFGTVHNPILTRILVNMKRDNRESFRNNIFVKPLYKTLKNGNKIKPQILFNVDTNYNLDGKGVSVKRKVLCVDENNKIIKNINKETKVFLPGECENVHGRHISKKKYRKTIHTRKFRDRLKTACKMIDGVENKITDNEIDKKVEKINQLVQAEDKAVFIQTVPNTWLRLYPQPMLPQESACSVLLRCILCQLGLATSLVIWTIVWVFVIHSFEGPHELKVSLEFEKEQNQLVIDLATELRQITPVSPKWRSAIERRIQDERQLTLQAVTRGARVHPGQFWDLSGTFLFTIYVMTALGFGAPVPQTIWGRSSALSYAIIAVPTHIYLMVNMSMCIVVHAEVYVKQLRSRLRDKKPSIFRRSIAADGRESPNCRRNIDLSKVEPKRYKIAKKMMRLVSMLGACRSVPLAAVLYYVCGAIAFGVLRGKVALEVVMFPLEFTTSGGLEHVRGHVRILYGLYVEGAMTLLACALATLRRHSSAAVNTMSDKYRLFATEK